MKTRVLVVFGTRPEAIKMAPVVNVLRQGSGYDVRVCVTGQHREMLDQVLAFFSIEPDFDLDIMRPGQDLYDITSAVLAGVRDVLRQWHPHYVFVHGDTTTCMAAAMAAFYERIMVVHVEAGLRTGDLSAPFPEEMNRCVVGRLARLHFAPTVRAQDCLLREGIDPGTVLVTGNTVIDALQLALAKIETGYGLEYWESRFGAALASQIMDVKRKKVLITGHRRENFGEGIVNICHTLAALAREHPDWLLVFCVHRNPKVSEPVNAILAGYDNVALIEPLEYDAFVWMMNAVDVIVTDSGGVQEEAPSLGKPVLVTREVTERPEAVESGTVKLVGTHSERLRQELARLLNDTEYYHSIAVRKNPYGDGYASHRIRAHLDQIVRECGNTAVDTQ